MTNTTVDIDYALLFEEQRTLNRLFFHSSTSFPTPNPEHFERVSDFFDEFIVMLGKRSGTYFMAEVKRVGNLYRFGRFSPAEARKREVIDWVWV